MSVTNKPDDLLTALRESSMATIIRDHIEADIIGGLLKGGSHLTEVALAQRFNVSRGPIREALRTLEGQGLVNQQKNCGWFVRLLSQEDIEEVFTVRKVLDNGLADLLVAREPEQLQAVADNLNALATAMDQAISSRDSGAFAKLNQRFHNELLEASNNSRLLKLYRNMMGEVASHVARSLTSAGAMVISNYEHYQMIDALLARDAAELRNLFQQHREHTLARMLEPSS